MRHIVVGAVAYAPQIVPIWDIIREYARAYFGDIALDYVLFSNYERQVQWLMEGKIDIAWNTNVAFVRSQFATNNGVEAILMRDTDVGFKSVFVAQKGKIKQVQDLVGKSFGLGSLDSAQAAIMPLYYLKKLSIPYKELALGDTSLEAQSKAVRIYRFNSDVGKHGDTGRSEFDVLDRIRDGALDAGAIGSSTWVRIMQEGSYPHIESFYASPEYCHCNFTTLRTFDSGLKKAFVEMMCSQNEAKDNAQITQMMSMEGLNKWIICDAQILKGYDEVAAAMREQNLLHLVN